VSPGGNSFETRTHVVITDSAGNTLINDYVANGQTRKFDYLPLGRDVTVTATRERRTQTGAWGTTQGLEPPSTSTQQCYSASCTARFASNVAGKPNGVKGGTGFFYVEITNNGPLMMPDNLAGTPLSLGGLGFASGFYRTLGIYPGDTVTMNLDGVVAPHGVGNPSFGVDLSYRGRATLEPLAQCAATIDAYEPFSLTPLVNSLALSPDPEDPDSANYTSQIVHNTAAPYASNPVQATSNRMLVLRRGGVQSALDGPVPDSNQFITRNYNNTYNTPPVPARYFQVGDRICAIITIDKGSGYIGPGGPADTAEEAAASSEPPSTCETVENRPVVRSYMGDVVAGGNFEGSSVIGNGVIKAYTRGAGSEIGSGVEFAAEAMKAITGFSSAFLRTSSPTSPNGLSFANTGAAPCAGTSGCFRNSRQVYNYFDGDMKQETIAGGRGVSGAQNLAVLGNPANDGKQTWVSTGSGKLALTSPPAFRGHHELFVEGDVFIRDNIVYTDGPWVNIQQIPNFRLVVKGDIYISRNVTQLDGFYVAQPIDATNGGRIYTCARDTDGSLYSNAELYDACRQRSDGASAKLQINGGFIAQEVHFLRTLYTLSDAPGTCLPREVFACDHAAESFRLSPDYFLGLPASQPKGGQSNGKYQDIKTLPPIL
jgi:hypothetical protein